MRVASIKLDPKKPIRRKRAKAAVVPIESRITILGHQKVILDSALAEIYGVPVKRLNQQVRRNARRFPVDFMFQVTRRQFAILKMQFATSRLQHGGRRSFPFAFTEHGAIMAATVLNSDQAVEMSVFVVRRLSLPAPSDRRQQSTRLEDSRIGRANVAGARQDTRCLSSHNPIDVAIVQPPLQDNAPDSVSCDCVTEFFL